jgi:ubiquinol-cytochrome c reductase cytochrome b subunit
MVRKVVRYVDERSNTAPFLRKALRYVFPDHWSFLLGEVALYCFVILVGTGIYLTLFFEPSTDKVVYHGSYAPLNGTTMSAAYRSAVDLSFDQKAGLLMRQTHHWAANVFLVAIVLHLMRVFFTGAFRKPRDLVWYVGVLMLMTALLEGFLGYSMVDDLLSGMGLAIAYSVVLSLPFVGANLALMLWGGPFPGVPQFESRMYIAHVLIFPVVIGILLAAHLTLIALRHHTQFRGRARTEGHVVGTPAFPGYAPRSIGLLLGVAAVIFLLGGLVQINPIWQWGPFETAQATNGAQPDWYLGWLIGALRLVPGFDVTIGHYTLVPNAFWGGALFPLVVFAILFFWPNIERRVTGDRAFHNLLDRPRDVPWRTALGAAMFSWLAIVLLVGASDRLFVWLGISYVAQIWVFRGLVVVGPIATFVFVRRFCEELLRESQEKETEQDATPAPRIVEG